MKTKRFIAFMLICIISFTNIPITVHANETNNDLNAGIPNTVSNDTMESEIMLLNNEDLENNTFQPMTFSASSENILNTTIFGGDKSKAYYSENLTYINGALCFYANDTYYVLPKEVTDTQYIWPDGTVDNIESYTDEYYNNIMPVKNFNDMFAIGKADGNFMPSSPVYTMKDGTEFVYTKDYKIYKSSKENGSYQCNQLKDVNALTDEQGNQFYADDIYYRFGGFSNGYYFTGYYANTNSQPVLFYNYDDVDIVETIAYRPDATCGIVGDSFWYMVSTGGTTNIVRHKLGTTKNEDILVPITGSYNYPQIIMLKNNPNTVYYCSYGLHDRGSIYAYDLSTNTAEKIISNNYNAYKLNQDHSVLTISTGNFKQNINMDGYYISTKEYYILDSNGLSESKECEDFYGTAYQYLFEDNNCNNGYAVYYAGNDINNLAIIGNPGITQQIEGKDVTLTTNHIRKFLYNRDKLGTITYFSSSNTTIPEKIGNFIVKSVDNDCTKGLYIESNAGIENLPTIENPHIKENYSYWLTHATCSSPDIWAYDCKRCAAKEIATYEDGEPDPTKHTDFFDERNITIAPTCTEPGFYGYQCSDCGKNVYEYEYLYQNNDNIDHSIRTYYRYVDEWNDIRTDYDKTYDDVNYIAPLGHDYVFKENIKPPTCYESGIVIYECTRCHDSFEKTISPKGHHFETIEVIEEPTCTNEGYSTVTCADCGLAVKRYRTQKIDHEFELKSKETGLSKDVDYTDNDSDTFNQMTVYYDKYIYKCKHCGETKEITQDTYTTYDYTNFTGPVNIYNTDSNGKVHIDTDASNGLYYRSTQSIDILDENLYSNITINDLSIKDFLNTTTDATNIAPTTLYEYKDSYSLKYMFNNSCANRSPGYTGAFDFYAYPDALDITVEKNSTNYTFDSNSFYHDLNGNTNVPMKDVLYCIVNLKDTHNTTMTLDMFSYPIYNGTDYVGDISLGTSQIYRLDSADGIHFSANETNELHVFANQNNYYLIEIKPDYNAIKNSLENYNCDYNYDITDPNICPKGMELFLYGARLVPSFGMNDDSITVTDNPNFTRDNLVTTHYISGSYEDVNTELSVDYHVDNASGWHSYSALYNTNGTLNNLAGQYIIHSYTTNLKAGEAEYYKGDYENQSNRITIPATNWLITEPTFKWYFENEDGIRIPIMNNTIIDNYKFNIQNDVSISGETIENIDESTEVIVSCDICTSEGDIVKTYYGALVFDNLEPELTLDPGEDVTISENTISTKRNIPILLDATVRYLKEGTTDQYVDTDEPINWYFKSNSTSKVYKIDTTGNLMEVESETYEPLIRMFSFRRSLPSGNTIEFIPPEDGVLIARFEGRYGSVEQSINVSLIVSPTGITASYIGNPVKVGNSYSKSQVVVKLLYDNGTSVILNDEDWTASDTIVSRVGDNVFTATYETFTNTYAVEGIPNSANPANYIVKITANYIGNPVKIGENYNKNDVLVKVYFADNTIKTLAANEWTASGLLVEHIQNTFTATYLEYSDTYDIEGYLEDIPDDPIDEPTDMIQSIIAIYQGPDVLINHYYNKNDVLVKAIYQSGKEKIISTNNWTESSLKVTNVGKNTYTAYYQDFTATYQVNGCEDIIITDEIEKITAEYKGPDIIVNHEYNKDDVVVTIIYKSGKTEIIPSTKWLASGLTVTKEGQNTFTAKVKGFETPYYVNGYNKNELIIIPTDPPVIISTTPITGDTGNLYGDIFVFSIAFVILIFLFSKRKTFIK